jgi:hypothetical protein
MAAQASILDGSPETLHNTLGTRLRKYKGLRIPSRFRQTAEQEV